MKKCRGSLTVESALIVPVIILSIFWLLNISLYIYHYAFLKAMAHDTVVAAQRSWENPSRNVKDGNVEGDGLADEPLYWHITGMGGNNESRYQEYTYSVIEKDPLSNIMAKDIKSIKVKVEAKREMLFRWRVNVKITENRKSVFSSIRKTLGLPEDEKVVAESSGVIEDPAELIRNCDLANELVRSVDLFDDALSKLEDMRRRIFR